MSGVIPPARICLLKRQIGPELKEAVSGPNTKLFSLTPLRCDSSVEKIEEIKQNLSQTEPGHSRNLSLAENLYTPDDLQS
jgi:hypothetical protein